VLGDSCRRSELFFHLWNHELTAAPLSAIILAGGKSPRKGTAKFLLPFDSAPLIVHMVRKLSSCRFSFTLSVE
jgi:molybdopterin-guanine dinucleotide biosynthesis protein A